MRKGSIYTKDMGSADVIIPEACVLYVGIELIPGESILGSFILQTQDHEDILHLC
jgi:hypothetical protein